MLLSKAAEKRHRDYPITYGAHTVEEYATLKAQGRNDVEIARLWGMRPLRGKDDLKWEVHGAWERFGKPGCPEEPSQALDPFGKEWTEWRAARDAALSTWLESINGRRTLSTEVTPDGHPQVWLLYRPEPFAPGSDDDRSLHLWVRRADVFTSRVEAIAFLDNLLGHQVRWDRYAELHGGFWPELWIGFDHRGCRWLMEPAPVNPPGGQP